MISNEQAQIWGNFWQILDVSKKLVQDYEKLLTIPEITRQIPQMDTAFIDAIIVHVAKLFSASQNEPFRIEQFKAICRKEVRQSIEKVEEENKGTIRKIVSNRNKLVAHLDKRFYELCFSDAEIERMQRQMANNSLRDIEEIRQIYSKLPRAKDKKDERYSIQDFRDDLSQIRHMLEQLEDIWNHSIPFAENLPNYDEKDAGPYLSLSLRFANEYRNKLCDLRKKHGEDGLQESPELTIYHRALWTALIVEVRKLFGTSFKEYKNFSLREIDFFRTEPYKKTIDEVYDDRTIQDIIHTSNTFTVHFGKKKDVPFSTKDICESNLDQLLNRLQAPIDAFAKHRNTK